MGSNFCGNLGKFSPNRAQIWQKESKSVVFCIFWTFCHFFFLKMKNENLKWKFCKFFTFYQTPCLAKFFFWSYCPKCSWPTRLQDYFKCNISKKISGIKLIFSLQINIRVSYKLVLLLVMSVTRHVQSTQNSKFVVSM